MNSQNKPYITKLIRQNPLLRILDDRQINLIYENGQEKLFQKGQNIFKEGDNGNSFFLLLEGSIRIYKERQAHPEILISIIRPSEIFAEIVITEKVPYPFSAQALEKVNLFTIHRNTFRTFLKEEIFRDHFISSLFHRIRYMSQIIHDHTEMDIEERFFRFLFQSFGQKTKYKIPLSKKEIASCIGTIPETISRLIRRLTDQGTLTWKGSELSLKAGFWENTDFSWKESDSIPFHIQ